MLKVEQVAAINVVNYQNYHIISRIDEKVSSNICFPSPTTKGTFVENDQQTFLTVLLILHCYFYPMKQLCGVVSSVLPPPHLYVNFKVSKNILGIVREGKQG